MTRCELIERIAIETIQKSKRPDAKRAWSKIFEFKHGSSVIQLGRVLAQKRGLDSELAAIICALHDIYVFATGRCTDHAHKGALIARKILEKTKKFNEAEIKVISTAIYNHSDKHVVSKNPYVEFMKDIDAFDCSLYYGVHDAYLYEKSLANCKKYFARIRAVREELNLPRDPQWDIFEYVERGKAYEKSKK